MLLFITVNYANLSCVWLKEFPLLPFPLLCHTLIHTHPHEPSSPHTHTHTRSHTHTPRLATLQLFTYKPCPAPKKDSCAYNIQDSETQHEGSLSLSPSCTPDYDRTNMPLMSTRGCGGAKNGSRRMFITNNTNKASRRSAPPCPTLSCPACPALPHPALPCPTLPYVVLPCPSEQHPLLGSAPRDAHLAYFWRSPDVWDRR